MEKCMKPILLGIVGVLCALISVAQDAKVVFKSHPVFQRYPAELIKETRYNMVRSERVAPGDSITFLLRVTDPEGEYYRLYDWGALNVFVKPGSTIVIDYNDRERTKTKFSGDLAAENAWLNQSWFLSYQMLYPKLLTPQTTYKEYERRVFSNADSLKRVVKSIFLSKKFVEDCQCRIDFMVISTLLNYYQFSAQSMQRELSAADFESWNRDFKLAFSKVFLKKARHICKLYKEQEVLQYWQTSQALMNVVHNIEPGFAGQIGYSLFEEEYALMQVLNDVTRLYSPELLDFPGKVKDSVILDIVNEHIKDKRDLLTGVEAMDFEFKDMDGNACKLSDYKGMPIFIDVWATWCNPCKALAPVFHGLAREYKENNIKFISVSIDKKAAPWMNYLNGHPRVENVLELHSGNKKFQEAYKISGIPRFILIDKNFKIRMAFAYRPGMKALNSLLDLVCVE